MLIKDQLVVKKNTGPGTISMSGRHQVDIEITGDCMHNTCTIRFLA